MSTSLVRVNLASGESQFALTEAQAILRRMVMDSVQSIHSKRNYAKALDDLFAFSASRPLSRALLMEYRTTIDHLSPSTINVRLSAIRKLVSEARRNGMIGLEQAAILAPCRTSGRRELGWAIGLLVNRCRSSWRCLIARPSRVNAIMSSLLSWSAALCAGKNLLL